MELKCVDTSFLVDAEHDEALRRILHRETFVVPAIAAAEFLLGVRLVKNEGIRQRAQTFYEDYIRPFVFPFDEAQAQTLATLIATQRRKGRVLKPYDAGIAAAALELRCPIFAVDSDFDGIDGLDVIKLSQL